MRLLLWMRLGMCLWLWSFAVALDLVVAVTAAGDLPVAQDLAVPVPVDAARDVSLALAVAIAVDLSLSPAVTVALDLSVHVPVDADWAVLRLARQIGRASC